MQDAKMAVYTEPTQRMERIKNNHEYIWHFIYCEEKKIHFNLSCVH